MKKKIKILYGVTGIGYGHTFRQLPIIEYFARSAKIVIFAYDNSYRYYKEHFKKNNSIKVIRVAVPFYAGDKYGLNFKIAAKIPENQKENFIQINFQAMHKAFKIIGRPNLVISDYEPISAQYAYAHNAPLITIDQQSKFLSGSFPQNLKGYTFRDEIERLHMFFPKIKNRIVCSFFKFKIKNSSEKIKIFPPTIKNSVLKISRHIDPNCILLYISSAREFGQSPKQIIKTLKNYPDKKFHLFINKKDIKTFEGKSNSNIYIYPHGSPAFNNILGKCAGIISTAGHSLLSEAMYLGIPVYAIPVSPYEQHLNAHIVDKYKFGISNSKISPKKLEYFIKNIPYFTSNIIKDKKILNRTPGQNKIISFIEKIL